VLGSEDRKLINAHLKTWPALGAHPNRDLGAGIEGKREIFLVTKGVQGGEGRIMN